MFLLTSLRQATVKLTLITGVLEQLYETSYSKCIYLQSPARHFPVARWTDKHKQCLQNRKQRSAVANQCHLFGCNYTIEAENA